MEITFPPIGVVRNPCYQHSNEIHARHMEIMDEKQWMQNIEWNNLTG
jgi:hypothetical protein